MSFHIWNALACGTLVDCCCLAELESFGLVHTAPKQLLSISLFPFPWRPVCLPEVYLCGSSAVPQKTGPSLPQHCFCISGSICLPWLYTSWTANLAYYNMTRFVCRHQKEASVCNTGWQSNKVCGLLYCTLLLHTLQDCVCLSLASRCSVDSH